jgi:hypothetical protein
MKKTLLEAGKVEYAPGKFAHLLTDAREKAGAEDGILILFSTKQGDRFCAQLSPERTGKLPSLLREMADHIEQSMNANNKNPPLGEVVYGLSFAKTRSGSRMPMPM